MEKFEISFNLEGKTKANEEIDMNGKSLIPTMLPEAKPAEFEKYNQHNPSKATLYRQYHLNFVPSGIILFTYISTNLLNFSSLVVRI
jgi:hypothetical protein